MISDLVLIFQTRYKYFLNCWQNCAKSEIMAKIEPVLPRTNSDKLSGVNSFPPKVTFRPLAVTAKYFRRHYIMNLRQEVTWATELWATMLKASQQKASFRKKSFNTLTKLGIFYPALGSVATSGKIDVIGMIQYSLHSRKVLARLLVK